MLDLFRVEAETQTQVLVSGLLALERDPTSADQLEACMRAAHSIKGAARVIGLGVGVGVPHAMEDCFVSAQRGEMHLGRRQIDLLLRGVDLLTRIAMTAEADIGQWEDEKRAEIDAFVEALRTMGSTEDDTPTGDATAGTVTPADATAPVDRPLLADPRDAGDRVLRVTAENLNRLLGLAGESLVESRWLKPFAVSLLRLKRLHYGTARAIEDVREALTPQLMNERLQAALSNLQQGTLEIQKVLSQRLIELELYDSRSTNLAHRLYGEALASRMRPFADGVQGFPRMVRDVGRALAKPVRLEIVGHGTQVDRDMLEKLDAPLGHLLRNAIDHGIESPEERVAAGKPAEGVIQLQAHHSAGMLQIVVADDGAGIDLDRLRSKIVARKLTTEEVAGRLSEAELLEFLFLPGFTMKETVTDISGRGVGLDVVQDMIRHVRGTVRVSSQPGKGARFLLQLPLALSVVRTLLVDIGGEPYAFPLAYIVRTLKLPKSQIELMEGREHFSFEGRQVGLVSAQQVLGGGELRVGQEELSIVVVGDHNHTFALVVDRFLGERELVVQTLDTRLGKVKDISAGALMADGSPTLIIDMEDMIRSIDKLVSTGHLSKVERGNDGALRVATKRVLVVDDSLTVRELERKLLGHRGYEVEVAVDGVDGWNAVRTGHFDLVVTDVDMPRMNGIELVSLIKKDPNLKGVPVMIVSYKDREEDRRRGLDAGADYYFTKGSFHDESLLQAVADLIGEPQA